MGGARVDSVFGLPQFPGDASPPHAALATDAPISDLASHRIAASSVDPPEETEAPAKEVEWVNSELLTISSTIEELQSRLQEANARLANAPTVETTEFDIGRLFVEAQRFSEASLSKLEVQIHEILCEAEAKARQILTEATEEGLKIRHQAQDAARVSTRTARELQVAIAGFTAVNSQLVKELGALNSMLDPASEQGTHEIEPASDPLESD